MTIHSATTGDEAATDAARAMVSPGLLVDPRTAPRGESKRRSQDRKLSQGTSFGAIVEAAVELFAERGFAGTTMRDLANRLRVTPGSIYHYFPSKQDVLFHILDAGLDEVHRELVAALDGCLDADERLRRAIVFHVRFHCDYSLEAFVIDTELRSLEPQNRRHIVARRKRYEALVQEVLQDGVNSGVFAIDDVKVASYGIIAMCTGVAGWFNPAGRATSDEVASEFAQIVIDGVRARPSGIA